MTSTEYRSGDSDSTSSEQKGHFCATSADAKECCGISNLAKLLVCVLCGIVFGVALHKAHGTWIYSVINICQQFFLRV